MSTKSSTQSSTRSASKESSALPTIEQAVEAYRAAAGPAKVKLVNGLTEALRRAVDEGRFEEAGQINAAIKAIEATKSESAKPKVSRTELLANQAAVLRAALDIVENDAEFSGDQAPTLSEGDINTKAAKLATVRKVTRGKAGNRQAWILEASAAMGDGNHTVNDLITKSGVAYPGSNTQPNGAVGDWHTTHEGETFEIEGGTMTVGFDDGHGDGEKGHRVFIVTMD